MSPPQQVGLASLGDIPMPSRKQHQLRQRQRDTAQLLYDRATTARLLGNISNVDRDPIGKRWSVDADQAVRPRKRQLDYRKLVILSRSATSIEEVLSVKGPPIAVWPSTNKHLQLVVRVPYSAAVAIATRGQDGLGTGCHHFVTPSSFAITFAAL